MLCWFHWSAKQNVPLFCIQQTDAARKTDGFCICYISKTTQNLAKKKTGHCLINTPKQSRMRNLGLF